MCQTKYLVRSADPELKHVVPELKHVVPELKHVVPELKHVVPELKHAVPEPVEGRPPIIFNFHPNLKFGKNSRKNREKFTTFL